MTIIMDEQKTQDSEWPRNTRPGTGAQATNSLVVEAPQTTADDVPCAPDTESIKLPRASLRKSSEPPPELRQRSETVGKNLRLLAVLAHPDDESMGLGGTLAMYAAEGVETYLITATRGQQGWFGAPEDNPGPEALGKIRETELQAAAQVLGLQEVTFLDYIDGDFGNADTEEVVATLVGHIQRIRPDVVVTFDHNGLYGHPDHIAATRFTAEAIVRAAASSAEAGRPHQVAKLYHRVWTQPIVDAWESAFGSIVMEIDGQERRPVPWPEWAITTRIDASKYWKTAWEAIECHRSQLPAYETLLKLPPSYHEDLWANQEFFRVFGSAQAIEGDLFAGLREGVVASTSD
jgi:LmbE family N-acetylglucosaminyl deacetylase